MGDRLRVVEDFDVDALELLVPSPVLQPLVENAIRHGIGPKPGGGCLRLAASITGGSLVIDVADDGMGAQPDAWHEADGLGLDLVQRQLDLRFGARCRVKVTAEAGRGFSVCLVMPARLPGKVAS